MKQLISKLKARIKATFTPLDDVVLKLKNAGNLKCGENCLLENFRISYTEPLIKNFCNISIGSNCHLQCNIILLNPRAKISIEDNVFIGNTTLFCYESIEIKSGTLISWGGTI